MIQVNATYKPGDRPKSIIRNSGGLFCGVITRPRVFHLSSVVLRCYYSIFMRGRRRGQLCKKL